MDAATDARVQEARQKIFDPLGIKCRFKPPDGAMETLSELLEVFHQAKSHLDLLHELARERLKCRFAVLEEMFPCLEQEARGDTNNSASICCYLLELSYAISSICLLNEWALRVEYRWKVVTRWQERAAYWKEEHQVRLRSTLSPQASSANQPCPQFSGAVISPN